MSDTPNGVDNAAAPHEISQRSIVEQSRVVPAYEQDKEIIFINNWQVTTDTTTHSGIQQLRQLKIDQNIPIQTIYGGFTESPVTKITLIESVIERNKLNPKRNGFSVQGTAWPVVFISELETEAWDTVEINPFEIDAFTNKHKPEEFPQLKLHYGDILNLSDEYYQKYFGMKDTLDISNIPEIAIDNKYGYGDITKLEKLFDQIARLTISDSFLLTFSARQEEIGQMTLEYLRSLSPKYEFTIEQLKSDNSFDSSWNNIRIHNIMRYQFAVLMHKSNP